MTAVLVKIHFFLIVPSASPLCTDDTGTSYAVIWKCKEDCGEQPFKIKLTVYQMDFLQVITVLMLNNKT